MAYGSRGRKPFERASKINHAEIINNPEVAAFLKGCTLPSAPAAADLDAYVHKVEPADTSAVRMVVAIDGGYTETYVREDFPSAAIAFFTFGPLLFRLEDLRRLDRQRFIAPEDLATLKHLQRYTLTLPIRGIRLTGDSSLVSTVRRTLYDFFGRANGKDEAPLLRSLHWLLFRRWESPSDEGREERLARCPNRACGAPDLVFRPTTPTEFPCPACGQSVYLTDLLRLDELVDEEQGAAGVLPYVMTLLEQMVLVHVVRSILGLKPALLGEVLFLKDGPLAFFGQVARLYAPMRELTTFLLRHRHTTFRLAGLEKSGQFVDHAAAVEAKIPRGHVMIPDNAYIYRHIIPGDPTTARYGSTTYFGSKVFYRDAGGDTYVATVPTGPYVPDPTPADIPHLYEILQLLSEMRCHMYDNALVPIALANKLVSLSDFPSQRILTEFARQEIA